jgi:hypothetical protein
MKKTYVKPTVSKIDMDGDVICMITKEGFEALFWKSLQQARKESETITQEAVFDALNDKYYKAIGCTRYASFESFRQVRNKK